MDLAFWLELALFVLLLLLSGFFSSSETSLFSLNSVQLQQMRQDGNPRIGLIERMLAEPRRLIVTILIGNEFVNVAASVLSAAMIIELLGADNKLVNLLVMVPILLVFGEITPKTLAIRNNVAFATAESGPIDLFARAIAPIRWLVRTVSDWFTTLIVGRERSRGNIITEDMVRTLAHEAVGEGALDQMEAQFIDQIFDFGNKTLEEIQTPRADIDFIPFDIPVGRMLEILRRTRQSRYPVYGEHRDDILGILHARDLIAVDLELLDQDRELFLGLLRKPYFVPETKPAVELFDNFRHSRRSFALTVDEYGGVTGLVTMEDLLECIFGDIPSPSDEVEQFPIEQQDDGSWLVDGAIPLERFRQEFDAHLACNIDIETLGGFVLHAFGELPAEGECVRAGGFEFSARQVARNRIARIGIRRLPQQEGRST
ncbi:MAG TPA: HlyC/CorC family transporter [Sedimenticola thiotaurini]|uniref:HlyC/CorC family transporter n=1 Tax=Sedimenticola thiotaurini TaxID=1543721 RepID=A0A831RJS2_9GAMM|nr:HlyC/CorC family transporter [Sedimenticola thiotaurini]